MERINLLALSGSLRKASYNTAALRALQALVPENVEIVIGEIGDLPLFNPDREGETIPALTKLKSDLKAASGLIISSPEYAHGISGPMKNAFDWLVSGDEFPYIPIMLINTSPRASHALEAMKEVLRTMAGNIIDESFVSIPLLGSNLNADGVVANREIASTLRAGLDVFTDKIKKNPSRFKGLD